MNSVNSGTLRKLRPREIIKTTTMASNLVELAEIELSGTNSSNIRLNDNVKHMNSTKGYGLNIDRTLRKKINACREVRVEYSFTGGGITGEMDTATFELFRAACTTFYSRLPPEQGYCEIDMSEDKHRKAVVQQTYKVKSGPDQSHGYTINLYTTRNRILINGKDVGIFMDEHLAAIHDLMMKPIHAGIVVNAKGLNDILSTQMQTLLNQRQTGLISKDQLLPQITEDPGSNSPPGSEPPKCSVCKRVLRSRGVLCEKGQHWIHYRCDKLSQDEIDRLHNDKGVIFICKQCSKEETIVKVPVESKQDSTSRFKLELPSVRHESCSQVEEILNEEQGPELNAECCVCDNRVDGEAIACMKCNLNCHKDCTEACGIDFLCLSCNAIDTQISLSQVNQSSQNEATNRTEKAYQPNLSPTELTKPKTVSQSNLAPDQTNKQQELASQQPNVITQNTKSVNNIDVGMKQRELRQWELKLRKHEESLKMKELKQNDQDKEKHRLHEYINKLEARNDELSKTISTLQRRIDILENPLVKSEMKADCKEPQQVNTQRREEIDDLIIGVRDRVTRFVLGRVSEQLDALEKQNGTGEVGPRNGPQQQKPTTPTISPNSQNSHDTGYRIPTMTVNANQRDRTTLSASLTEQKGAVNNCQPVNSPYPSMYQPVNIPVVEMGHAGPVNTVKMNTNMMDSQHLVPPTGERQNAIREPEVIMPNTYLTNNIGNFVGQPLIRKAGDSQQSLLNQHFLYMASRQQNRR